MLLLNKLDFFVSNDLSDISGNKNTVKSVIHIIQTINISIITLVDILLLF